MITILVETEAEQHAAGRALHVLHAAAKDGLIGCPAVQVVRVPPGTWAAHQAGTQPGGPHEDTLPAALARWATRDPAATSPPVRQAANTALAAIDARLAGLHATRRRLTAEMRAADAQAAP